LPGAAVSLCWCPHWEPPQQFCAVCSAFSEQPPVLWPHLLPQRSAEFLSPFAHDLPCFSLQADAASFPEQHEAASFVSFLEAWWCIHASPPLWSAGCADPIFAQQSPHGISVAAGFPESVLCIGVVVVCAHEVRVRARMKASILYFMTTISINEMNALVSVLLRAGKRSDHDRIDARAQLSLGSLGLEGASVPQNCAETRVCLQCCCAKRCVSKARRRSGRVCRHNIDEFGGGFLIHWRGWQLGGHRSGANTAPVFVAARQRRGRQDCFHSDFD
jgi:hypothetical protein